MKKIIKCLCILALIAINVYIHLYDYNELLVNNLILSFTLIFCLLLGKDSFAYRPDAIKYILIYIFWNMNYLVLIKHFSSLDGIINTLLFKNVAIDILAVLAIGNILLLIINHRQILNIIFSIIFLILFIIFKNTIFIYVTVFLIGNILKIKDLFAVRGNIFKTIDYLSVGILIFHKIALYLLINSNIIKSTTSDFIGTIVLTYIVGIVISYYIKAYPIIREII